VRISLTLRCLLTEVFPKLDIRSRKELRHARFMVPGGVTGEHD
jgi:hypothetical protein